jgi:DUF1009 family protein
MPGSLGIIAGGGGLPAQVAEACRRDGRPYFVLALKGYADAAWLTPEVPHAWLRMGAAGKGFRLLRQAGCDSLVMAGPVRRPSLWDLRPEGRAARFFARVGLRVLGDDGLLRAVIGELETEGFTVLGVDDILGPDILAPAGVHGRLGPDARAEADIRRGLEVARGLGALDVGQGCVVQQGMVLAVEAIEGTDAMLRRAGGLRRDGPGGVLVKACKPQQDRRADLPTIGPATLEAAHAAGLRGIAVTAGGALIVDRAAVVARADALGLFVVGVADDD